MPRASSGSVSSFENSERIARLEINQDRMLGELDKIKNASMSANETLARMEERSKLTSVAILEKLDKGDVRMSRIETRLTSVENKQIVTATERSFFAWSANKAWTLLLASTAALGFLYTNHVWPFAR